MSINSTSPGPIQSNTPLSSAVKRGISNEAIYTTNGHNLHRFNMFKLRYPENVLSKTSGFTFFSKPMLNIIENMKTNRGGLSDLELYVNQRDSAKMELVYMLNMTSSEGSVYNSLLPILTNNIRSFDIADTTINNRNSNESYEGWSTQYGTDDFDSLGPGDLNLTFDDDREQNVFHLINIWKTYIAMISYGKIKPNAEYRYKRRLDYAGSIFNFRVAENGFHLVFWNSYIGSYPMNTPSNVYSDSIGDATSLQNYSIQFHYSNRRREMDLLTLHEFNKIVGFNGIPDDNTMPHMTLDKGANHIAFPWSNRPLITKRNEAGTIRYCLRWQTGDQADSTALDRMRSAVARQGVTT